ncbi:unnamed protein product [Caenorhabditis angaria]|uniref:Uncharacterized protein n=1 Tax=Caenorhabditis angaria TaxID=860376 RepID=A0A9P1N9Z9_9PELO|nr:unnamed protein product [Caenorhabditis angaria]
MSQHAATARKSKVPPPPTTTGNAASVETIQHPPTSANRRQRVFSDSDSDVFYEDRESSPRSHQTTINSDMLTQSQYELRARILQTLGVDNNQQEARVRLPHSSQEFHKSPTREVDDELREVLRRRKSGIIIKQDEFEGEPCHSITITNACFGHIFHAERTEDTVKIYRIIAPQIVEIEHDATIDILHRAQAPDFDREWAERQHAQEMIRRPVRRSPSCRHPRVSRPAENVLNQAPYSPTRTPEPPAQRITLELLARLAEPIRPARVDPVVSLVPVAPHASSASVVPVPPAPRAQPAQHSSLAPRFLLRQHKLHHRQKEHRQETEILEKIASASIHQYYTEFLGNGRHANAVLRVARTQSIDNRQPPLDRVSKTEARFDCNSITDVRQRLDAIKNALDSRNYSHASLDLLAKHQTLWAQSPLISPRQAPYIFNNFPGNTSSTTSLVPNIRTIQFGTQFNISGHKKDIAKLFWNSVQQFANILAD